MLLKGATGYELIAQSAFLKMLDQERKRAERSRRAFGLMLLETAGLIRSSARGSSILDKLLNILGQVTRETDIKGWYRTESVIGIIFTEIDPGSAPTVSQTLLDKINTALLTILSAEQINRLNLCFYIFPEQGQSRDGFPNNPILELDGAAGAHRKGSSHLLKRLVDILGSTLALVLALPLFAVIAIAIKSTSKGPIFFRQQRLGLRGRHFTFLKFRSMYVANDTTVHRQFVQRLILDARTPAHAFEGQVTVYKLTSDSRITPVGKLLRRTSLDELPQLINVLIGDMSLVGPRPPIPYEVECYETWHKRRLWEVKPGITGLWQVSGRSRVPFAEMVRLDLRYARSWSLWLDIKILARTPLAVLGGAGAY